MLLGRDYWTFICVAQVWINDCPVSCADIQRVTQSTGKYQGIGGQILPHSVATCVLKDLKMLLGSAPQTGHGASLIHSRNGMKWSISFGRDPQ